LALVVAAVLLSLALAMKGQGSEQNRRGNCARGWSRLVATAEVAAAVHLEPAWAEKSQRKA